MAECILAGRDGPKGDKGDKGDKGATGATGATGPQGPAGTIPSGVPTSRTLTLNAHATYKAATNEIALCPSNSSQPIIGPGQSYNAGTSNKILYIISV